MGTSGCPVLRQGDYAYLFRHTARQPSCLRQARREPWTPAKDFPRPSLRGSESHRHRSMKPGSLVLDLRFFFALSTETTVPFMG